MTDQAQAPLDGGAAGNGKMVAAGAMGALTTVIAYVVDQFLPHPLPAEIVGAVQTLLTAGAVWFAPHGRG